MEHSVIVGKESELRMPEGQRRRWGLTPAAEFAVDETPVGLFLRPLCPPLTKVYVEPTTACNLQCKTYTRSSCTEPEGLMPMATYQRLIDGLCTVPSVSAMAFWGFGEPLLHPHIADMVALAGSLGTRDHPVPLR